MLRLIVQDMFATMAVNVSGARAELIYRTFDIDAPDLEAYMRQSGLYRQIQIIGAEVIVQPTPEARDG